MTDQKKFKRRVKLLQAEHHLSYSEARRRLEASDPGRGTQTCVGCAQVFEPRAQDAAGEHHLDGDCPWTGERCAACWLVWQQSALAELHSVEAGTSTARCDWFSRLGGVSPRRAFRAARIAASEALSQYWSAHGGSSREQFIEDIRGPVRRVTPLVDSLVLGEAGTDVRLRLGALLKDLEHAATEASELVPGIDCEGDFGGATELAAEAGAAAIHACLRPIEAGKWAAQAYDCAEQMSWMMNWQMGEENAAFLFDSIRGRVQELD